MHNSNSNTKPCAEGLLANALNLSKLFTLSGNSTYATKIAQCAKILDFMMRTSCNELELSSRLREGRFCKLKLCPICQWRHSLKWKARAYQAIPKLLEDYPTTKYILLTLTAQNVNVEEVRTTIEWMNSGWRKLIKRKCFPAIGWVKSIEVTRNTSKNTCHPHIHALLAVKSDYNGRGYIKKSKWRELWKDCLKVDYLPVVSVEKVTNLEASIPNIVKYSTKGCDTFTDTNYLAELSKQLQNCRMIETGGVLREYFVSE